VSSALVDATAAGATASTSARFSGEIEAREVGQRSSLRVTLSLLVGCSGDKTKERKKDAPTSPHNASAPAVADCASGAVTWEAALAIQSMVQVCVWGCRKSCVFYCMIFVFIFSHPTFLHTRAALGGEAARHVIYRVVCVLLDDTSHV